MLQLVDQSKQWTNENFSKLLPIVLVYLRYGLIFNQSEVFDNLQPSPIVQWENLSRLSDVPNVSLVLNLKPFKIIIIIN